MKKNKKMIVGFLAPAVIIFLIVFLYPIIRTIMMSMYKIESVTDTMEWWTFVGLGNYQKLFTTAIFKTAMMNILKIWALGGIIVLSVSLLFGVILTSGIRGKKFFRAIIYLPNIVSAVALATMWLQYVYSSKFGLLKSVLDSLGLHKLAKTPWLDSDHKFWALLFAYCFGMIGYHMLIWMSGIERISPDLFEAATIDGANKPQQFRYMTMPLLKGVFKTNITMWTVSTAAFFVWSQLFSTVTADKATIVPVQYMYMHTFGAGNAVTERNAGYGAAIGIILCLCVVIVFSICNKLIKDCLLYTSDAADEWILAASLSTTTDIFAGKALKFPTGLHFENYVQAWGSGGVATFFMNSMLYSLVSCFLLILICAPAAYVLARFTFLGNKIIQTSFVSAMGIPITMIVLPLFSVVANLGILNSVFASKVTLIFLYIGINIPYTTIFLLTFFSNLSRTYEEAAAIDGCPPTKTFWKIMFPMAQSGIVTVTIFNFINIWNEYFLSLIFANNDTLRPVAVGLYGMLQSMQYTGNWAGMFAAVVIVFLPTFILYLFLSEKIIGGVTGGIKG